MNDSIKRLEAELNKAYDLVDLLRYAVHNCDETNVELILANLEAVWDALDVADSIEDIYRETIRRTK